MPNNVVDNITLILPLNKVGVMETSSLYGARFIGETQNKRSVVLIDRPSATRLRTGNYEPKITLSRQPRVGGMSEVLKIDFNAPKLLFGNNLQECADEDFDTIIQRLLAVLTSKGLVVSETDLRQAQVVSLHVGKNLLLPNGIEVEFVLQELAKLDLKRYWDSSRKTFRNDGKAVMFHSSHFELAFYDKLTELKQRSPKRCIEEDGCFQQLPEHLRQIKQVLRFEVRMGTAKQIRSVFDRCGIEVPDLCFQTVFKSILTQKINTYFWDKVVKASITYDLEPISPDTLLRLLRQQHKGLKALQLFGLTQALQTMSVRELRMLFKDCPTFSSLLKQVKSLPTDDGLMSKVFRFIKKQITENITMS